MKCIVSVERHRNKRNSTGLEIAAILCGKNYPGYRFTDHRDQNYKVHRLGVPNIQRDYIPYDMTVADRLMVLIIWNGMLRRDTI